MIDFEWRGSSAEMHIYTSRLCGVPCIVQKNTPPLETLVSAYSRVSRGSRDRATAEAEGKGKQAAADRTQSGRDLHQKV